MSVLALAHNGELHSWFAFKASFCVGTVPDMPIHNLEVLLMSTLLLAFGGQKVSTLVYWYSNPDTGSHSFCTMWFRSVWLDCCGRFCTISACRARLPAVASLFAALRVLAMPRAVFVGFVCGIAPFGPCPHLASFQSFGLGSEPVMMIGVLWQPAHWLVKCCLSAFGWRSRVPWPR